MLYQRTSAARGEISIHIEFPSSSTRGFCTTVAALYTAVVENRDRYSRVRRYGRDRGGDGLRSNLSVDLAEGRRNSGTATESSAALRREAVAEGDDAEDSERRHCRTKSAAGEDWYRASPQTADDSLYGDMALLHGGSVYVCCC